MSRRKGLVLLGLLSVLLLASQSTVAEAHTPGPITLDYDSSSGILTVTVTHSTSDVNSHYIYEIVVQKNSVQVDIETYTSQGETSGVTETFTITAVDGDVLSATAKCSVSGQITGQTTVTGTETTSTTTTTTTTTPDYTSIAIITAGLIMAMGIVLIVVLVTKRR